MPPSFPKESIKHDELVQVYFVDLREKPEGFFEFVTTSLSHRAQDDLITVAAERFYCSESDIVQLPIRPTLTHLVVGNQQNRLQLIVHTKEPSQTGCLLVDRSCKLATAINICIQWLEQTRPGQHILKACLLSGTQKLTPPEPFLKVENFEIVELVCSCHVVVRFIRRLNHCEEKAFYVDCYDTDSVREIKDKLLSVCNIDDERDTIDSTDAVWITHNERILAEDDLLRSILRPEINLNPALGLAYATLHVHFKPNNVILVKLICGYHGQSLRGSTTFVLLTPDATLKTLRWEISKIIHKEPAYFEIAKITTYNLPEGTEKVIREVELMHDADLTDLLKTQDCAVVVTLRPPLRVQINKDDSTECFPVVIHKNDSIRKLKQEASRLLGFPCYCVELRHNNLHLSEHSILQTTDLRHGATITALVLPNRICTRVRLKAGYWEDIIVDDVSVSTTKQLKYFVRSLLETTPNNVLGALLNGQLLDEASTLQAAGVKNNDRIIIVQAERLCFTVENPGKVPLIIAKEDGLLIKVIAMCDGKEFYFKNPQTLTDSTDHSAQEPVLYLSPEQQQQIGFKVCSREMKRQFLKPKRKNAKQPVRCASSSNAQVEHSRIQSFSYEPQECLPREKGTKRKCPRQNASSPLQRTSLLTDRGNTSHASTRQELSDLEPQTKVFSVQSQSRPSDYHSFEPSDTISGWSHHREDQSHFMTSHAWPTDTPRESSPSFESQNNSPISRIPQPNLNKRHENENLQKIPVNQPASCFKTPGVGTTQSQTFTRSLLYSGSIHKGEDGKLIVANQIHSTEEISPEMVQAGGKPSNFNLSCSVLPFVPFALSQYPQAMSTLTSGMESDGTLLHDRTFAYIKKDIIHTVARELGQEGPSVVRQLVPDRIVHEADHMFPSNIFDKHYHCLTKWCQMKTRDATVAELKRVLADNGRSDLCDTIDEIESRSCQVLQKQQ